MIRRNNRGTYAAKRHMDIKRNITGHNIIIADITGYSLKKVVIIADCTLSAPTDVLLNHGQKRSFICDIDK